MESLLTHPALRFGDDQHDVADLVLAGLLDGEWRALEDALACGLALEAEHPGAVTAVEVEEALSAFRYERRLIAAAELRRWLAERALQLRDLQGVLRRRLLREQFPGTGPAALDPAVGSEILQVEAICSGALARCAGLVTSWHAGREALGVGAAGRAEPDEREVEALTGRAAADIPSGLPSLGPDELRRRVTFLVALHSDHQRFRATAVTPAAIAARLAERRLEWMAVKGSELAFELEGAARETRLHVTHDGRALADVAAMLDLEPVPRELDLAAAPKEIRGELLAAQQGELVGPWREEDRWRVLHLERRSEPSAADARASARARDELLGELVERFSAGKAVVLAPL